MMTLEIHPEELLDKAAAGTLTESEQTWLDGHLAQCQVCRFERQARADFAAVSADDVNVDDLVSRALVGAQPEPKVRSLEHRRRRRSVSILAGTALVFSTMASFAAVAQWTGVLPKIIHVFVPPPPVVVPPPKKATPRPAVLAEPKVETVEVVPPPAPIPTPKPVPVKRPVVAAPTPAIVAVAEPETASLVFDRANRARVQGQRDEAIAGYRALLTQFPAAPEANLTRATLGRLLLDSGDAPGGLVELDAYLRTGDLTLREEVLSARALALQRLGRPAEEASAWKALLDGYPESIHAPRAQARLQELGKR